MNVDIRIPIGGMFSIIGLILIFYGLITAGNGELYARSLGINMNLWWGLVMFAFGGTMFYYGRRAKSRP
jgi:hypothetical protein